MTKSWIPSRGLRPPYQVRGRLVRHSPEKGSHGWTSQPWRPTVVFIVQGVSQMHEHSGQGTRDPEARNKSQASRRSLL